MPETYEQDEALPAVAPERAIGFGVHALPPGQLVTKATEMAMALTKVIQDQGLFSNIQGKKYVQCEGWTTAAAMIGLVPGIEWTKPDPSRPGVYISQAVLTDMRSGTVVARANAECGDPDEKDRNGEPIWASRAAYARRSMSETRAVSKVCRLALSWVVKMAGFDPTPAEEVPAGGFDAEIPASVQPTKTGDVPEAEDYTFKGGKHKGQRLADVPADYLGFLCQKAKDQKDDPNEETKKRDWARRDYDRFKRELGRRKMVQDRAVTDAGADEAPF